jgi:hypothetical protein
MQVGGETRGHETQAHSASSSSASSTFNRPSVHHPSSIRPQNRTRIQLMEMPAVYSTAMESVIGNHQVQHSRYYFQSPGLLASFVPYSAPSPFTVILFTFVIAYAVRERIYIVIILFAHYNYVV